MAANYDGFATINPFSPVNTPVLEVLDYLGWGVLTLIGIVYLTGRSLSLPVPNSGVGERR